MALNDNATLIIGSGNYFTAPVGTNVPTDLAAPGVEWENIGHTSLEDILSIESEGGEKTILGTLQNKQLRSKTSTRTDSFSVVLQQWDTPALKLYYGSNAVAVGDGLIGNPNDPQPTVVAFLAVFVDGENIFAIYCPKVEIFRGDDIEFADTENLAGLPLSITPMTIAGNDWNYALTPVGTYTPPSGG